MKTQTKTKSREKTTYVLVNAELQENNKAVEEAYTKITDAAIALLKKFELTKYRTHLTVEHCKDPQNTHLVREFVSFFWNITLSNSKEGKSYIFIALDESALEKFGNGNTNHLLRSAFNITQYNGEGVNVEYSLRVNYIPMDVHNFFYRRIVEGETDTVSIYTEEHTKA